MPSKLARFLLLILVLVLAACQPAAPTAVPSTKLKFTYWGSEMEKAAIEGMVATFEARNPDIDVQAIQIPYEDYLARITAMMRTGRSRRMWAISLACRHRSGRRKASCST